MPPLDAEPDLPLPFGYKCAWFAIRTSDTQAVAEVLSLAQTTRANWAAGLEMALDFAGRFPRSSKPAFVAPPVQGWTLVAVGLGVTADSHENVALITAGLDTLSRHFGEAQYFGSYRVVDYVAWFRSVDGTTRRGFSHADGQLFANLGQMTQVEEEIGSFDMNGLDECGFFDELMQSTEDDSDILSEETPAEVAGAWSVNPLKLDKLDEVKPATGLAGFLPG